MVAFMLDRHDHAKPIMRSIARELLSSCVLRSLMTFFSPYTVNKASHTFLTPDHQDSPYCLKYMCSALKSQKPCIPHLGGNFGLVLADHFVSAEGESSQAASRS